MRVVPEWVGATDDTPVPARVKIRVFERYGGVCYLSRRKIRTGELWDVDHITAICNGGINCESNLAPALRDKHKDKTKRDLQEKSLIATKRKKFLGLKTKSRPMPGTRASGISKKFDGTVI